MEAHTTALPYRDRKRPLWLLSLFVPTLGLIGPALYLLVSPSELWLWLSPLFFYFGIPLLDALIGEDPSNPPESEVPALEADLYYRWITYLLVPVLWVSFIAVTAFVASQPLSWSGLLAMIINTGGGLGFAINLGHEMGHKKPALERWLGKLALALSCYGHFYIEHNRGHHRDVATPHDSASSRMGESIYRFALRELPGGLLRAWQLETERLARGGKGPWSLGNEILQTALISLALYGGLVFVFGLGILPFLLLSAGWGAFQLTSANYLEHYGLLRRKLDNGRYEVCQPHHSWNSNHLFSNWALFHLQRHSDHHAYPTRRYQSLRNFPDLPRLPSGYFGMYLVAYVPPLWFRLMNPRLIEAVQGDATRINFQPGLREPLMRRYGLHEMAA
ncbi:alkane 1-monooxygenase [Pseudomonas sp. BMS12]|uniref:alkane 1-monooxygenase n=1 Tax=Pseudomonas sp. BMS12 TaxID=1796033 RepID=UPI00083A9960|nr:alkane 1-monooxygenase [Pseudomonas sp. BMS12]